MVFSEADILIASLELSLMIMKHLTLLIAILFFLNGCKDILSGSDDDEISKITANFTSESNAFLPGEIQFLKIDGVNLDKEEYNAMLGNDVDVVLKHKRDGNTNELIFIVPEIQPGSYSITLENYKIENELEIEVREYSEIENPESVITEFINNLQAELEQIILEASDENFKNTVQTHVDEMDGIKQNVSDISEEDRALLARMLHTYLMPDSSGNKSQELTHSFFSNECQNSYKDIVSNIVNSASSLNAMSKSKEAGAVGLGIFLSDAVSTISSGTVFTELYKLIPNLRTFWDHCIAEIETPTNYWVEEVDGENSKKNKRQNNYEFVPNREKGFIIHSEYEAPKEIQDGLDEVNELLDLISGDIPESWVQTITHDYVVFRKEDPSGFRISNISDENIEGEVASPKTAVLLKFSFINNEGITKAQEFSFSLGNQEGINIDMEGILLAPFPKVKDLKYRLRQGEEGRFKLEAEGGATFEITEQPKNGTVTLFDDEFEYKPNEGFDGKDSLKYVAVNSTGQSEEATVTLEVLRNEFIATVNGTLFNGYGNFTFRDELNEYEIGGAIYDYAIGDVDNIYFFIEEAEFAEGDVDPVRMCVGVAVEGGGSAISCYNRAFEGGKGTAEIIKYGDGILEGTFSFSIVEEPAEPRVLFEVSEGSFKIYLDEYFENQ
jgi:rRNA maturation protein Rpf1